MIYDQNPLSQAFRDANTAARHLTQNWDINAAAHDRVVIGLPIDTRRSDSSIAGRYGLEAVDAEAVRRRAPASRAGSLLNRSRLALRANLHGACPNRPCAAWTKSVRGDHCPECVNPID